jgi:hypothetical protein
LCIMAVRSVWSNVQTLVDLFSYCRTVFWSALVSADFTCDSCMEHFWTAMHEGDVG